MVLLYAQSNETIIFCRLDFVFFLLWKEEEEEDEKEMISLCVCERRNRDEISQNV